MSSSISTFKACFPYLPLGFIGFIVRMPYLNMGSPQQYHPDEWAYLTTSLKFFNLDFINTGMQIPNVFMYLIFAAYLATIPFLMITGNIHSFAEFYSSFYAFGDPYLDYINPHFLITARMVSVLITVALGILIALHVRKSYSQATALSTALIFYCLPTEFLYSRFALPDMCLTAALFSGIVLIVEFSKKPSLVLWIWACIATSIATSVKLPGAVLLIPLIWSLWSVRASMDRRSYGQYFSLGLFAFLAGGAILSPNMIFTPLGISLLKGIVHILLPTQQGSIEVFRHDTGITIWQYFIYIYEDYGPAVLAITIPGLVTAYRKTKEETITWLLVIIPFFLIFQCASAKMSRYIIPVTSLFFILTFPAGL